MPRAAAAQALEAREAELALGYFPDLQRAGYFQQALFKSTYECIACAHSATIPARLTLKSNTSERGTWSCDLMAVSTLSTFPGGQRLAPPCDT